LCLCLNILSCTTKKNSDENVLFFREHYGEIGWYNTGNDDKHGKYLGEIKKNKPHGQGTYTYYKNPKDSLGQLSILIPEMPKIIVYVITLLQMINQREEENLPAQYIGNWNRGKKHGEGTYFFPNGDKYVGKWKHGKKHGHGTYFFSNGDKYEGKWKHGKQHGEGKYFFPKGDHFKGNWKKGIIHGEGIYTYPSGEKFSGEWNEGKKNIQGPLILSD
tara:strand:- start:2356 stop:3006 length:651 start_codon:yes stop_codon:yes gene_type:complete